MTQNKVEINCIYCGKKENVDYLGFKTESFLDSKTEKIKKTNLYKCLKCKRQFEKPRTSQNRHLQYHKNLVEDLSSELGFPSNP